jgi:hypothetical protein
MESPDFNPLKGLGNFIHRSDDRQGASRPAGDFLVKDGFI